jgi:hypothetical protein
MIWLELNWLILIDISDDDPKSRFLSYTLEAQTFHSSSRLFRSKISSVSPHQFLMHMQRLPIQYQLALTHVRKNARKLQ